MDTQATIRPLDAIFADLRVWTSAPEFPRTLLSEYLTALESQYNAQLAQVTKAVHEVPPEKLATSIAGALGAITAVGNFRSVLVSRPGEQPASSQQTRKLV